MEAAGVCQERGVNALGDFLRYVDPQRLAEVVNHFTHRGGGRVYQVNVAKRRSSRVVIDVDDKLVFEIWEARPIHVTALDNKGRIVLAGDFITDDHRL